MIKSLSTLMLTFIFTFTQAMAFAPNQDQLKLGEQLDAIDAKDLTSQSQMSEKEFKKSQKKIINGLKKELKKVKTKSVEKQTKFALNKLTKRFKRFRALSKLSFKNKRKIAKIAAENGSSIAETEANLKKLYSKEKEREIRSELISKIDTHGSYSQALQAGIEEVKNTTYEESIAASKAIDGKSEINRKPAQFEALIWVFFVFYLIIPIALVVVLTIFFATGGIVGGVIFSAVFLGYLVWITSA
ncbi:hypothetical protein N9N67_08625 [Bacteriovoracaceae bacterium]|nr:hypothetical protein [Bacteriovoracaceae bacterium]